VSDLKGNGQKSFWSKEGREFADGARKGLMQELGVSKRKAYNIVGMYPVRLIYALVKWYADIPRDVQYRTILAVAEEVTQSGNISRLVHLYGAIPSVHGTQMTLEAIINIAASFAPAKESKVLVEKDAEAKAEV
jgi:hypothetical protein